MRTLLLASIWPTFLLTAYITTTVVSRARLREHLRAAEDWARRRGLDFSAGASRIDWTYQPLCLDHRATRFQISGSTELLPFTLAYVGSADGQTVVILHLRNAYASTELERRRYGQRRRTGHRAFDRKFVVDTELPGGPAAAIPATLAQAMIGEELPRWSLRERELFCFVEGRRKVDEYDRTLGQAVRIAGLLKVR